MKSKLQPVINHTPIYRVYHGQWVVLDESRKKVLAAGRTLQSVLRKFRKQAPDEEPPSVLKVPNRLTSYVGSTA